MDRFKILGTNGIHSIPWVVIKRHEDQALLNHGQTLEQLNRRGGLTWVETNTTQHITNRGIKS